MCRVLASLSVDARRFPFHWKARKCHIFTGMSRLWVVGVALDKSDKMSCG